MFVGVSFLLLYLMGILFGGAASDDQCSQGYLSSSGCSVDVLSDHIFSAASNTLSDDYYWSSDELGPLGFTIQNYLVPSVYGAYFFGQTSYFDYGLPYYSYRNPILWSNLINSSTLVQNQQGFGYSSRSFPPGKSDSAMAPNDAMYSSQEVTLQDVVGNGYPECPSYAPETTVGSSSSSAYSAVESYSAIYGDATFWCPECTSRKPEDSVPDDYRVFFNGTYWTTKTLGGYSSCSQTKCALYPYSYINFMSSQLDSSFEYMGSQCPSGIDQIEANSNYYRNQGSQLSSMTYLNLLSNLLVEPNLDRYPIQTGFSYYGELNFDAVGVSQQVSNILTVIGMLLMNGFWPMAVWRLSHERSQDIVLMMRTVGMKAFSYVFGMFLFDMLVSVLSGVAMIVFAVQLKLIQFEGSPIGYLVAIVLLSSWAINAMALLIVRLLNKKASILPMAAPCILIASVAACTNISINLYPNDGTWPWVLSIYPFFAQGRALYIILVYHQTSSEVDTAFSLMFLVGLLCLIAAYVYEIDYPVISKLKLYSEKYVNPYFSCGKETVSDEEKRARKPLIPERNNFRENEIDLVPTSVSRDKDIEGGGSSTLTPHSAPNPGDSLAVNSSTSMTDTVMDEDAAREKNSALAYSPTSQNEMDKALAIVIKMMTKRYDAPVGGAVSQRDIIAVRELSLALAYGECFGLLGYFHLI